MGSLVNVFGSENPPSQYFWHAVIDRVNRYPQEAAERNKQSGNFPLHVVSENFHSCPAPLEVFQAIVEAYPLALKLENNDATMPLNLLCSPHMAPRYVNGELEPEKSIDQREEELIRWMVQAFLRAPNPTRGDTSAAKKLPYHQWITESGCRVEMTRILLEEYPDGVMVRGLNDVTNTNNAIEDTIICWDYAVHNSFLDEYDEEAARRRWNKLKLMLMFSEHGALVNDFAFQSVHALLRHVAHTDYMTGLFMEKTQPVQLGFENDEPIESYSIIPILRHLKDRVWSHLFDQVDPETGLLPLQTLLSKPCPRYFRELGEQRKLFDFLVDAHPPSFESRMPETGRSLFHLALWNGWIRVVNRMLLDAPLLLQERDTETALLPFQLAAAATSLYGPIVTEEEHQNAQALNTIYSLLREAPDLIMER